MKIIILSPSLYTNQNVSGISSVTQFIINHNTEHEYVHFNLGRKDSEIRNIFWVLRMLRTYFNWICLMVSSKQALIHFNLSLSKYSIIRDYPLILMARLFHKRMIIHIHGGELLMDENITFWIKKILGSIFSDKNQIVVLGLSEKETIYRKFGARKISVLPNCIDLSAAKEFERSYKKTELIQLLFLGRISVEKGIEYIFRSLGSLKDQGKTFKFFMAGTGPDETVYVSKFQDLLGKDFEYRGIVSGDIKTALLKNCNIFLLPSFYEGLPMALIESMSFGLIPITTDVGSIKDIVIDGETGIIVRKKSAEDIESAIKKLLEETDTREKLSRNARNFVFNYNNVNKYIFDLNRIYEM
jgi:glycosyltransferase involved in cell wall biosynthesis